MPAPDPYLPGHGDTRYRVHHYDLRLVYRVSTNRLDEVATLQVETLEDCTHLELDLVGLQASRVVVDGRRVRHRRRDRKLVLELPASSAGARHVVQVHCAGKPRPVPGAHGSAGWEELTDGVLVGSQPYGAPGWFPCNDDAAGKATFRIQLDVASGYHVVANGTLVERQQRGGTTRWTYLMDAPMAPYLASVHIGRYVVEQRAAGVPVELVHPPDLAVGAGTAFEHQAEMVELFSSLFGPYPFDCYRAVVTDDALEIPLEAQGLSSFGRNFAQPTWDNERLVAHELAHQWFGNSLTATTLSGIWLHEGFACYAEWLWAEHRSADGSIGGVQEQAARHHAALVRERHQQLTPLSDPGMRDMFDDWVYKRGALALHAVRCVLGSEAFFEMLRCWTQRYRHSVVTTQDFAEHCAGFAGSRADELRATLSSWLDRTALPPLPVLRG